MIHRLVVAALVVSSLALPQGAAAAPGDGAPLRTLCSDPTMSACMSIWTFDFAYTLHDGAREDWMPYRLDGTAVVDVFGSAFENRELERYALVLYFTPPSMSNLAVPAIAFARDPGRYTLVVSGDGPYFDIVRDPVLNDITGVYFNPAACGVGGGQSPCYEVPEPGSLLLLATGLGGVVIVGWRRAVQG